MSDTIRYRSVPGSNDRMVRFIAQFEGYLAKRLAREDSIANHTFAHCKTYQDSGCVWAWLRRN